jgi:hypothetical protein
MSQFLPCPKCATPEPKLVGNTWWGSVFGAELLSHVRCTNCGFAYNGKTGKSNVLAITLYVAVGLLIVLAVVFRSKWQ